MGRIVFLQSFVWLFTLVEFSNSFLNFDLMIILFWKNRNPRKRSFEYANILHSTECLYSININKRIYMIFSLTILIFWECIRDYTISISKFTGRTAFNVLMNRNWFACIHTFHNLYTSRFVAKTCDISSLVLNGKRANLNNSHQKTK